MDIDASKNGWEHAIILEQIKIVQKAMEDKFYNILLTTYQKYVDKFYSEFHPKVYTRTLQLRNALPVELKPIIKGDSIECGIDFEQFNRVHYEEEGMSTSSIIKEALFHGGHGGYEYTDTAPFVDMEEELQNDYSKFEEILKTNLSKAGFIVL